MAPPMFRGAPKMDSEWMNLDGLVSLIWFNTQMDPTSCVSKMVVIPAMATSISEAQDTMAYLGGTVKVNPRQPGW